MPRRFFVDTMYVCTYVCCVNQMVIETMHFLLVSEFVVVAIYLSGGYFSEGGQYRPLLTTAGTSLESKQVYFQVRNTCQNCVWQWHNYCSSQDAWTYVHWFYSGTTFVESPHPLGFQLLTVVTEEEAVLNSRPLTYVRVKWGCGGTVDTFTLNTWILNDVTAWPFQCWLWWSRFLWVARQPESLIQTYGKLTCSYDCIVIRTYTCNCTVVHYTPIVNVPSVEQPAFQWVKMLCV